MRPLHLVVNLKNDVRPNLCYIQVRGGTVYATNAFAAARMPVEKVFGENLIQKDETLYFHGADWKKANMHKAVQVTREDLYFTGTDKRGSLTGTVKAKTNLESGTYPDIDAAFPALDSPLKAQDLVSFDVDNAQNLIAAFGADPILEGSPYFELRGTDKALLLRFTEADFTGVLMPTISAKEVEEFKQQQAEQVSEESEDWLG